MEFPFLPAILRANHRAAGSYYLAFIGARKKNIAEPQL